MAAGGGGEEKEWTYLGLKGMQWAEEEEEEVLRNWVMNVEISSGSGGAVEDGAAPYRSAMKEQGNERKEGEKGRGKAFEEGSAGGFCLHLKFMQKRNRLCLKVFCFFFLGWLCSFLRVSFSVLCLLAFAVFNEGV